MNEGALLATLSDILRVPIDRLSDATEIDPPSWESIQLLDVIAATDESYGTTVPFDSLMACKSLGALRNLIRSSLK